MAKGTRKKGALSPGRHEVSIHTEPRTADGSLQAPGWRDTPLARGARSGLCCSNWRHAALNRCRLDRELLPPSPGRAMMPRYALGSRDLHQIDWRAGSTQRPSGAMMAVRSEA